MDLTHEVPRSPYEKLGGIVFLPRSIDKGRADLAGTLGEYVARTGRSERLFEFLGVSGGRLHRCVARPSDGRGRVGLDYAENTTPRTPEEIEEFNRWMWAATPEDEDDRWTWAEFREFLDGLRTGPSHGHHAGTSTAWTSTRVARCQWVGDPYE